VRLRSQAAVAGLGGAEVVAVARLAPAELDLEEVADAAVVIGDAALAAAALATGELDVETCELARRAWDDGAPPS
jgi:predicted solute-binding protein